MITLFKYRPFNEYLKPIISSQKIWYPNRANLNDDEDLQLNLINDVDAEIYRQFYIKKAKDESMSSKCIKYNLKKLITAKGELSSEAKQILSRQQSMIQMQLDSLGTLSLTDKKDCPDLWEDYGDQEKGVCITFRMKLAEHLLKVEYETTRPQMRLSQLLLSEDADKELIKVLKTKTTKWAAESEWRYFSMEGNKELPILGAIEAVKLGKKMPDADRQTIAQWVSVAEQPIFIEE